MIIGNCLSHQNIEFLYDIDLPMPKNSTQKRPSRCDFSLYKYNIYIEVLQNDRTRVRGKRREKYSKRQDFKEKEIYKKIPGSLVTVNSDISQWNNYEENLCIELQSKLKKHGILIDIPESKILVTRKNMNLNNLTASDILNTILKDCSGIADYQNNYSTIRNLLKITRTRKQ